MLGTSFGAGFLYHWSAAYTHAENSLPHSPGSLPQPTYCFTSVSLLYDIGEEIERALKRDMENDKEIDISRMQYAVYLFYLQYNIRVCLARLSVYLLPIVLLR